MQIAVDGDWIFIKDPDYSERQIISKLKGFKFDRKEKYWHGPASLQTLDSLERIVQLPQAAIVKRRELEARRDAFEAERANGDPQPMYKYPIKDAKLYAHQVQTANMALVQFGWA